MADDARRRGVLPSQTIRAMIASGEIAAETPLEADQPQPASLDLRLGRKAWRVRASFLPGAGRTVADRLIDFAMHEVALDRGAALERGCVYLIPLEERLKLPADVSAVA
ncbi:MAG: 2'-deoxycytidine 5'-triphosphate deaminase, partial [Pseudomonadota bacterium]